MTRAVASDDGAERFVVLSEDPERDALDEARVLVSLFEWVGVQGEYLRADTLDVPCYYLWDYAVDESEGAIYLSCHREGEGAFSFAIHAGSFELVGHPYLERFVDEHGEYEWFGWDAAITAIDQDGSGFDRLTLESHWFGTAWVEYDADRGAYVLTACAAPDQPPQELDPPPNVSDNRSLQWCE